MGEKLIVREGFRLTASEKRILFFHPIIRERKILVFTFILLSQNTSEPLEMAAIHKWLMLKVHTLFFITSCAAAPVYENKSMISV